MHIDSKANLRSKGKLLWQMDRLPQKCVTSFHATNRWLNIEFTDKWPFLGIYFSGPPPHFNLASEVHIPDQNNFWIIVFMVVSNIWKDAVWKWCSWKKTKKKQRAYYSLFTDGCLWAHSCVSSWATSGDASGGGYHKKEHLRQLVRHHCQSNLTLTCWILSGHSEA